MRRAWYSTARSLSRLADFCLTDSKAQLLLAEVTPVDSSPPVQELPVIFNYHSQ